MQDDLNKHTSEALRRPRILFVGEAVSLAHVSRPWVLAQGLSADQYEVHLACSSKWRHLLHAGDMHWHELNSISSEAFMAALAQGRPIYSEQTLAAYIEDDLELIARIKPDLIVGDFRLSLSVSATLAGVPYANMCNAYWSAYRQGTYPVPDHAVLNFLGIRAGSALMRRLMPVFMSFHARALNRLRRRHGLASLGSLQAVYTEADYTLYCDLPTLFPVQNAPSHHRYIGPIVWSPNMDLPGWWSELEQRQRIVYLSPGSSGDISAMDTVLSVLGNMDISVIMASAGRQGVSSSENRFVADYLPGEQAADIASLVICNGGSASSYQAFINGTPVIGIPSNLDQYLTMAGVEQAGAGKMLRAGSLRPVQVAEVLQSLLNESSYEQAAQALSKEMLALNPHKQFHEFLAEVL